MYANKGQRDSNTVPAPAPEVVQVSNNVKYERNAVAFFDTDQRVRVAWARADNVEIRNGGDPDLDAYLIFWATSGDAGASWDEPRLLPSARPADFNQRDLSFFRDDAGVWWVWASSGDSGVNRPLVQYQSPDMGTTWTAAFSVAIPGDGLFPAPIRLGHHHMIYRDDTQYLTYQASGASDIFFSSTTDGVTFTARVTIYTNAENQIIPKIQRTTDGLLYVATTNSATSLVHLAVSDDDGATWTKLGAIGGTGAGAFNDFDAFVVVPVVPTQNRLILWWAPNQTNGGQQLRTQFSPGGVSWSEPVNVTDGGWANGLGVSDWWDFWPTPVYSPDGSLLLTFMTSEIGPSGKTRGSGNVFVRRNASDDPLFTVGSAQ